MPTSSQISVPHAVVYDLEFTAWSTSLSRHWMDPGEFREIVQIGAVKVDQDFTPVEMLNVLVRPRFNPVLSDYLVNLTGVTNEALAARGVDFVQAWDTFTAFSGALPIISFGRDDAVITDNLRLYGMTGAPPMPRFLDLRGWLSENGMDLTGMHACDVGPRAGVRFDGHTHDGLCDALSVAAGIKALVARGAKPPKLP
jgi:inhibitor of KinA sporulation pathway (predicted exonuclease)